jgi:hypothetical protein
MLLCLVNLVFCSFGFLLGHLFALNSFEIFFSEGEFCYGQVVNPDPEISCSLGKSRSNPIGHLIPLRQQLCG